MSDDEFLSKDEHVVNFIKSIVALEEAMEPYKEQKRDLRKEYFENDWLTKEEMRLAVKAFRLLQQDTDLEQLTEYFEKFSKKMGVVRVQAVNFETGQQTPVDRTSL